MKDKEKQIEFEKRIKCGIAYCEDTPTNQIEEMARDLEEVETDVGHILVNETFSYVKEHKKYNPKKDFSNAHTKTFEELTAEEMFKKGYRKITDSVVLSKEEYEKLIAPRYIIKPKQLSKEELDKHLKNSNWGIIDNDTIEIIPILNEKEIEKGTAEKFAKLIEFHSISKRDESGYETFTISNLCLREILREEFGFTNEELENMWEIKE